ncbi:hypothetical protein [Bibersteinia trehalosi]|uniref:hypothetical protein n=1 Tax=Bibersteinia trehalosi TaxID=47735 RepID=UPI002D78781E|nr:hypothetical protein [Bibersteinia trehalosi]
MHYFFILEKRIWYKHDLEISLWDMLVEYNLIIREYNNYYIDTRFEKNIILDSEFAECFPFLCKDFSSIVILSTMYEPLFNKVNGEYNSYYIKKYSSRDGYLELVFFNDLRWSNGDYLTSTDVYNTLLYQIRNKTIFSCYLDFISGVSDYLYNDGDESLINIIDVKNENK